MQGLLSRIYNCRTNDGVDAIRTDDGVDAIHNVENIDTVS